MTRWTLVATLLLVTVVVGAAPGAAQACSCAPPADPAGPLAWLADAELIVGGAPVEQVDEVHETRWRFRVDERYAGASPDVIELVASETQGGCPTVPALDRTTLLLRSQRAGRWVIGDDCDGPWQMDDASLERYFGPVPAATGDGVPISIAARATRDHSLAVMDPDGAVLRYLPSPGATLGLGLCPGGERFVQVRSTGEPTDAAADLVAVVWSLPELEPVGTIELGAHRVAGVTVACRAADGSSVALSLDAAIEIVDGVVAVAPDRSADFGIDPSRTLLVVDGAAGADLALDDEHAWVLSADDELLLVPEPEIDAGRSLEWGLGRTSSVVARADGGWWLTVGIEGEAWSMSIGPTAIVQGPWKAVPGPAVGVGGPTLVLTDDVGPLIDVSVPSADPLPLFERTGRRIETTPSTTETRSTITASTVVATVATTQPSAGAPGSSAAGAAAGPDGTPSSSGSTGWVIAAIVAAVLIVGAIVGRRLTADRHDRTDDA